MKQKKVNAKLIIYGKQGQCPSGHLTKYGIEVKGKKACSFCLANGNCDDWFK